MALSVNLAQINSAAKGNQDLRETLTGIHLALQNIYAQTGSSPLAKVDTSAVNFTAPPAVSQLAVSGANGSFTVAITNAGKTPVYQEISSSPTANFASGVTVYPVSTNTSYVFPNPGAMLYWRLRSSYNQQNWSSYTVQPGAVSAGLVSSAATASNLSLNQSNYATVDSVADGGTATVRVYGSGGVGTSWTSILGTSSKVIPAGTIMNVSYATNGYVVWDGQSYQLKPQLAQTFPDTWVPVGKVSVIANGNGLRLPAITAVVVNPGAAGSIVAYQITDPGNGLTAAPILTITDSTGSGATATAVISSGSVTQVIPGSAGSGYSSHPTVTPSGGVSGGSRAAAARPVITEGGFTPMYSLYQQYLDTASGFHVIELRDQRGNRHLVQLAIGHDACPACGAVHPKDNLGALDPAAAIARVNHALNTSQQQMLNYAGKHGLTVR